MSKKPSAEEGGWAQEEESVQKAQRRRGGWAREKKSAEKAPRSNMTCFLNASGDIIAKNDRNIHTEKGWTSWKCMTELTKPIYRF